MQEAKLLLVHHETRKKQLQEVVSWAEPLITGSPFSFPDTHPGAWYHSGRGVTLLSAVSRLIIGTRRVSPALGITTVQEPAPDSSSVIGHHRPLVPVLSRRLYKATARQRYVLYQRLLFLHAVEVKWVNVLADPFVDVMQWMKSALPWEAWVCIDWS